MKKAILFIGLPGSGKTSIVNRDYAGDYAIVSSDLIKQSHKDYDPKDPEPLHQWSVKEAERQMRELSDKGISMCMDSGGVNNSYSSRIHLLESMKREHAIVLVTSCLREGSDFEWLIETARLTSAMGGMCFKLQRSQYGSQHFNWEGWKRIIASLEPSVAKMKEYYGYDEDGDEDDI